MAMGAPAQDRTESKPAEPAQPPEAPANPGRHQRRRWLIIGGIVAGLALAAWFLIPYIVTSLNTVSTDDAYVNGHVTFVAPRVAGQVKAVFADDNMRVKKGDVLLELDPEPLQIQVNQKQAAVSAAEADFRVAEATVRGQLAQARSLRWKLQAAMESVDNQVALLNARVAALKSTEATLERANADYERTKDTFSKGAGSRQDLDSATASKKVADAQVKQSLQEVYEARVSLGLTPRPTNGDLTSVPTDINQTTSSVRQALADLTQAITTVGLPLIPSEATPQSALEEFRGRDKSGDINKVVADLIPKAPGVIQAHAKLEQAKRDLDQANLNLRYGKIVAEIDGVVTRRNVNPGNNVQVGQQLMAVRSLTEIWIDANFKETQIANLKIGQRVEVTSDTYGSKAHIQGQSDRIHVRHRLDAGTAPRSECDGQLRQGRATAPRPHRIGRLQPGGRHALRRSLRRSLRLLQRVAGGSECRTALARCGKGADRLQRAAMSAKPAVNHWLVAAAVVIPTFMEVLDTTIANVALRYIAGGLSAAQVDSEWVITSYLAANAIVLPISGWLIGRLGRRNYFLISVSVFTLSSLLCGLASSLDQLILFRIVQGLAGGGLQPCSQGVLLDAFPKEKQGQAMTVFAIAALIAPIIGPTLGGYITDNYSWRWIFFINVPVGLIAVAAAYHFVEDPDYLKEERAKTLSQPLRFDTIGLGLLVVLMVCWEIVLSKGQEWDWFGDPFDRVQVLAGLFALCLIGFVVRELRTEYPVVNLRVLADRNFALCAVIIACAYGVLYGQSTILPGMLQTLFGYDAFHSGLVLSPSGIFAVIMLPIVATLMAKGVDARWLVVTGLALMALGNYWLAHMNLDIGPWQVVWPRVVTILGLSMLFAPLSVAAYQYISPAQRGAAVGLFSLLRNEGGSVGTSLAQTISERRQQFHLLRLNEYLDPLNAAFQEYVSSLQPTLMSISDGDPVNSYSMAYQVIDDLRQQQAISLAYFDVYWIFAILGALLIPPVFLMRRSVAEKGANVAAD